MQGLRFSSSSCALEKKRILLAAIGANLEQQSILITDFKQALRIVS
jgi:hypothetical protein